jgi:hypothetical protein
VKVEDKDMSDFRFWILDCGGSELNSFAGKDSELFWSAGILEYWSVGKS